MVGGGGTRSEVFDRAHAIQAAGYGTFAESLEAAWAERKEGASVFLPGGGLMPGTPGYVAPTAPATGGEQRQQRRVIEPQEVIARLHRARANRALREGRTSQ